MSNMSGEAKETANQARRAASAASGDLQADLEALRGDVARLASQLSGILGSRGNAAWRKAKTNVEGVVSDVQDKGMEAVDAVREVGDNMVDAIDESLKKRPYTTLALALTLGFVFGAVWRR